MAIPRDAKSTLFKIQRRLPANQLGLSIAHALRAAAPAQLPREAQKRLVKIPRRSGTGTIRTVVITPTDPQGPLPIWIHFHGGGFVSGSPESALNRAALMFRAFPGIILMPAYRLAGEKTPYPAAHEDCYDTLLWAAQNAAMLGGDPTKIAIGGEGAGGALTLATALRARDEGVVKPAFMFPVYPMIDDRESEWTDLPQSDLSWRPEHIRLGWDRLLASQRHRPEVPIYAAPARASDLSGLPPTLSFVGEHDLFLGQTRQVVDRLRAAGTYVVYTEFPNAYHELEVIAPRSKIAGEINRFYASNLRQMMDRFC